MGRRSQSRDGDGTVPTREVVRARRRRHRVPRLRSCRESPPLRQIDPFEIGQNHFVDGLYVLCMSAAKDTPPSRTVFTRNLGANARFESANQKSRRISPRPAAVASTDRKTSSGMSIVVFMAQCYVNKCLCTFPSAVRGISCTRTKRRG